MSALAGLHSNSDSDSDDILYEPTSPSPSVNHIDNYALDFDPCLMNLAIPDLRIRTFENPDHPEKGEERRFLVHFDVVAARCGFIKNVVSLYTERKDETVYILLPCSTSTFALYCRLCYGCARRYERWEDRGRSGQETCQRIIDLEKLDCKEWIAAIKTAIEKDNVIEFHENDYVNFDIIRWKMGLESLISYAPLAHLKTFAAETIMLPMCYTLLGLRRFVDTYDFVDPKLQKEIEDSWTPYWELLQNSGQAVIHKMQEIERKPQDPKVFLARSTRGSFSQSMTVEETKEDGAIELVTRMIDVSLTTDVKTGKVKWYPSHYLADNKVRTLSIKAPGTMMSSFAPNLCVLFL